MHQNLMTGGGPPTDAMNVVCTIDERYAQHCGAMICSLFKNNQDADLHVFVITDGMSPGPRERLNQIASDWGRRLEWRTIDPALLGRTRVSDHVSIATYFRVLIPRILPPDVGKALFLDADLIVRGSLRALYDQDIETATHAAVENPLSDGDRVRLSIPAGGGYFNGGVLLLNLDRWREERLPDRLIAFINEHGRALVWWDQDALNAVLHSRWRRCSPTWNAVEAFFKKYSARELGVSRDELTEVRTNPRIVHFTGSCKPWNLHLNHPFEGDYFDYLALTPWKGVPRPHRPPRWRTVASQLSPRLVKAGYRKLVRVLPPHG